MELEHKVEFRPAYDKRSDVPSQNFGIHGMEITFYVIGPKGAIQWVLYTNWQVPSAREHLSHFPRSSWDERYANKPWATDLGYHAHEPQYEDHGPITKECPVIGGKCYYDGSSMHAELLVDGFLAGGTDWLWPKLEAEYHFQLEHEGEWPLHAEAAEARARGDFP